MWYKLKWMYIWQQKIRPTWWQPTANTIGWWKLNGDTKDYSWNGYDGNSWSSYTTLSSWIKVASFDGSGYITTGYTATPTAPFTFIAWIRRWAIDSEVYFGGKWQGSYGRGLHEWFYGNNQLVWAFYGDNNPNYYVTDTTDFHLFVWTYDWTTKQTYWDNTLVYTDTFTGYNWFPNAYTIGWRSFGSGNYIWEVSSVIIEDKVWSAQDVADFWNLTKADYWL